MIIIIHHTDLYQKDEILKIIPSISLNNTYTLTFLKKLNKERQQNRLNFDY